MKSDTVLESAELPQLLGASFEIRLKMFSDWHIGSGAGRPGNIDSLVRRDTDDLPYVPAKTLTGIWRDACERVAIGLDDGNEKGPWNQWVDYLFGDQPAIKNAEWLRATAGARIPDQDWIPPREAAISVRSAHLPSDLRQALKTKPIAREAVTFVKPGVAIDPQTGSARPNYLRFEEMARGGISLVTSCALRPMEERYRRVASALLIAGARMVERLGGKRRRGAGRCELTIIGFDEIDPWLDWIEVHCRPELPPQRATYAHITSRVDKVAPADGEWLCVRLKLSTELPVIVPAGTVGNLIEALDYIPGTYLLPHVTRTLKTIDVRVAIMRGDLSVTNATIEVRGVKGRPVPFCLAFPKTGRGLATGRDVFNQLCDSEPDAQLKNHRAGYVGLTTDIGVLPQFETVDPSVETHNVIRDDVQRPTESVGGVYSYQAIPTGTTLRAELRLRRSLCDELAAKDPEWFLKLQTTLNVGRASKDDYGMVKLCVVDEPQPMRFTNIPKEDLTVWLLSDLLLRDERLRPVASIRYLGRVLEENLNDGIEESRKVRLEVRKQVGPNDRWAAVPRQHRTDSWHVGWGLPRPSLVGLQAGTCVVFKCSGNIDPERLGQIEASGLGERRAEGYGQVCFNDPLLTTRLAGANGKKAVKEKENDEEFLLTNESSQNYARLIEHQAVQNELSRLAPAFAAAREKRKTALGIEIGDGVGKPRMSQLGAFRSIVNRLRDPADRHRVIDWLEHLKATKNRREEWPPGSLELVRNLIEIDDAVWVFLQVDFSRLVLTTNGVTELKHQLWNDAVRALVDACVRAHKRDLEGVRNG
jgi:CRISPR-associated protein Csx10